MDFYYHPLSLDCQKVCLVMEEKNTKYNPRIVDTFKARNLDAGFYSQSPDGSIVVIVTTGQVFCDSLSMI